MRQVKLYKVQDEYHVTSFDDSHNAKTLFLKEDVGLTAIITYIIYGEDSYVEIKKFKHPITTKEAAEKLDHYILAQFDTLRYHL